MFTGIIAEQGTVIDIKYSRRGDSGELVLSAPATSKGLELGGSIAVNGVCLTATANHQGRLHLDVMGETLQRTTTGQLQPGDAVNLERCVPAGGRLDGHVVQGHVDGVGSLVRRDQHTEWELLRFAVPQSISRYIAEKGSIAVDGVSLTVTAVSGAAGDEAWFEVGLIPTTLDETRLGKLQQGSPVNLEVDVLAKYTERLLAFSGRSGQ